MTPAGKGKAPAPPRSETESERAMDNEAEERLDEALEESFPASDPIAPFRKD